LKEIAQLKQIQISL